MHQPLTIAHKERVRVSDSQIIHRLRVCDDLNTLYDAD